MTMDAHPGFAMSYGELERLLSTLVGADPRIVRARFRKLRLRPFPDDIQTGTGVRVRYDLRRTLAIAAVFEINNLYVPQGSAASMVEASWPECCRALLAAAFMQGIIPRPASMPESCGSIVEIGCSAVAASEGTLIDATVTNVIDRDRLAIRPLIAVDVARLAMLLAHSTGDGMGGREGLVEALAEMDRDFGWSKPVVGSDSFATLHWSDSFLDEGPYFQRALAFLQAPTEHFDAKLHPANRMRLQTLYGYLEHPSPIDAPKREIGHSAERHRLRHYLHFHAKDMGIDTTEELPDTLRGVAPGPRALALVHLAVRERSRLRPPSGPLTES